MIYSMTGFGKATKETSEYVIRIELKSLNSKFTDIFCRIPKNISSKEIEIRNFLTQQLERGKIELNIQLHKNPNQEVVNSNLFHSPTIGSYFKELKEIALQNNIAQLNETELFLHTLSLPNSTITDNSNESEEDFENLFNTIFEALKEAVEECKSFRRREGIVVENKFKEYISNISERLQKIIAQDKLRIPNLRERLHKSVAELHLSEGFDKNRFEQELIYYIEKIDISEEKVRLQTHLNYFDDVIKEGNGKKLNFLSQEIGREINTIGSKANDSIIQQLVVNMKDELEKIKEQTANVL
ncbi:YicC family protein [Sandaracinomonas limnophila]|uniref:YicC family protein n=1 Tax=Sandaracinomonas limnophila TaxID=1862386 RepID=A0A437PQY2_9BACT|nr:YicC/YloC family endoribonuclease [Sandaracinomonas limnophila]RVU24659.1 YicC family protein [Sandaracinomonas limnophila]